MSKLKNIIDKGLTEIYLNADIELIKESLREQGVDTDSEAGVINQYIKRLKFTHKAVAEKEKNTKLLEKIVAQFQEAINKNIDKPIATLKALIESKQLSVQFRNLDRLTSDEIKEIIKGKNLVDLMDELDDEGN